MIKINKKGYVCLLLIVFIERERGTVRNIDPNASIILNNMFKPSFQRELPFNCKFILCNNLISFIYSIFIYLAICIFIYLVYLAVL